MAKIESDKTESIREFLMGKISQSSFSHVSLEWAKALHYFEIAVAIANDQERKTRATREVIADG
jgi:hypothetical protein